MPGSAPGSEAVAAPEPTYVCIEITCYELTVFYFNGFYLYYYYYFSCCVTVTVSN